jgi:hypothetical protein
MSEIFESTPDSSHTLKRFILIPDERQLIEQAKQLFGQLTPDVRPIFGAVLIASAIRDAGNKIAHAINAKDKK